VTFSYLLVAVLPLALIAAAVFDVATYKIPNWLSLALALVFPLAALDAGMSLGEFGMHMGVGLVVLVAGFGLFAARLIGGGDAKLLAATSLWMGEGALVQFFIYAALVGGLLALALILFRVAPLPRAVSGVTWIERLHGRQRGVPYALALAIGGLIAAPSSLLVKTLFIA